MNTRAGRIRGRFHAQASVLRLWLFVGLLPSALQTANAAKPASHSDCALMVPLEEVMWFQTVKFVFQPSWFATCALVRRGKGASLTQCETLSESNLGGCWTQYDVEDTTGCQTCYIEEEGFADALFPAMFFEELDPCPSSVDYTTLYESEHGQLSLVTLALLTSSGCPEGWLYSSETDHCYFKSANTAKAADRASASSTCTEQDAWLIALETEAENEFLLHNMLWIGFFGETYTGLSKDSPSAEWKWPTEAVGGTSAGYDCLADFSDWLEGATEGCAASFDDGSQEESCMEIYPYEPKGWNPFSCIVGKHFVCEMLSSGGENTGDAGTPTPVPATSIPTTAPVGSLPSPAPAVDPVVTEKPTASPVATATTGPKLTVGPTSAPSGRADPSPAPSTADKQTVAPTTAPTVAPAGAAGSSSTTPTPVGEAETIAPITDASSATGAPESVWGGSNLVTITQDGTWGEAVYSLYVQNGDTEAAIARNVSKEDPGAQENEYLVKPGCYRFQVSSGADPTELSWEIEGVDPARRWDTTSGAGLEGLLFTVGGGVCDVSACHASCLEDFFLIADTSAESSSSNDQCDGYQALVMGACADDCPEEDDTDAFQNQCLSTTWCDPTLVCGVDEDAGSVAIEYTVSVSTLLIGAGDSEEELESAMALWLGVSRENVKVTSVNGVDTDADDDQEGTTVDSSSSSSDGRRRGLQTSDSSSSSQSFVRYTCGVEPESSEYDGASALFDKASATNGTLGLQSWLRENGGTWSGVSVVDVEAEIVETAYVIQGDPTGAEDSGDDAWYEENPLVTGAVAAAAVMILGGCLLCCFIKARRYKASQSITERPGLQTGVSKLTGDFEGGENYVPSDADAAEQAIRNMPIGHFGHKRANDCSYKKIAPSSSASIMIPDQRGGEHGLDPVEGELSKSYSSSFTTDRPPMATSVATTALVDVDLDKEHNNFGGSDSIASGSIGQGSLCSEAASTIVAQAPFDVGGVSDTDSSRHGVGARSRSRSPALPPVRKIGGEGAFDEGLSHGGEDMPSNVVPVSVSADGSTSASATNMAHLRSPAGALESLNSGPASDLDHYSDGGFSESKYSVESEAASRFQGVTGSSMAGVAELSPAQRAGALVQARSRALLRAESTAGGVEPVRHEMGVPLPAPLAHQTGTTPAASLAHTPQESTDDDDAASRWHEHSRPGQNLFPESPAAVAARRAQPPKPDGRGRGGGTRYGMGDKAKPPVPVSRSRSASRRQVILRAMSSGAVDDSDAGSIGPGSASQASASAASGSVSGGSVGDRGIHARGGELGSTGTRTRDSSGSSSQNLWGGRGSKDSAGSSVGFPTAAAYDSDGESRFYGGNSGREDSGSSGVVLPARDGSTVAESPGASSTLSSVPVQSPHSRNTFAGTGVHLRGGLSTELEGSTGGFSDISLVSGRIRAPPGTCAQ